MKTYNTSAFKVTFKKKMSAAAKKAILATIELETPKTLECIQDALFDFFVFGEAIVPRLEKTEEYKKTRARNMRMFGPSSKPQWGPRQIKKMQGRKPILFNKISKVIETIYPKKKKKEYYISTTGKLVEIPGKLSVEEKIKWLNARCTDPSNGFDPNMIITK